jgi:hypothetical protein
METNEEWLWRPIMHGMCNYEDVAFNKFDLSHIADMNELLDIREENDRRRDTAIRLAERSKQNA